MMFLFVCMGSDFTSYLCPSKQKPTLWVKKLLLGYLTEKIKGKIFGKNIFIGCSCYITHGLPFDILTIEILLVVAEIWTLLYRGVSSHFAYTEHKKELTL